MLLVGEFAVADGIGGAAGETEKVGIQNGRHFANPQRISRKPKLHVASGGGAPAGSRPVGMIRRPRQAQ